MKIEIHNYDEYGYKIYDLSNNKLIENHIRETLKLYWSEEDVYELLNDKQYKSFENGKYRFSVTKKDIFRASQNINYFK